MSELSALDVVAFGEPQIRLTAPAGIPLDEANELHSTVAGTEGNVLGLLAQLGVRTGLVTSLPFGPLARRIASTYAGVGLDLSRCVWRETGRIALYFVDEGSAPVPTRVYYDRKDSCFSQIDLDDVDWDYVDSAGLLHLSGITAALGDGSRALLQHAAERARRGGRKRSVDVNYRSSLWSPESACAHLSALIQGADVVFCSRRDAVTVFGIDGSPDRVAAELATRFQIGIAAVSNGPDAVTVYHDGRTLSATPPPTTIVDRVGAGDAFVGAFLKGVLDDDVERGLHLGIAAAALALTRRGDLLRTDEHELDWLMGTLGQSVDIVR